MAFENILVIVITAFVGLCALLVVFVKMPKRLKNKQFTRQWNNIQGFCKDKKMWPDALGKADKLLDDALKKRKFKGKSMGERMVSAQRTFTDNDGAWFAHNLRKKLLTNPDFRLREADVKDALMSFRQALRDMGALPTESQKDKTN